MSLITDNLAVFVVAAVVSALAWMFGGTRGAMLIPVVPWMVAFMVEVLYFFPMRRHGETTYDARERVWRDLKRDPLTWVVIGFMLLMIVPFVNNGLCVNCDAKLIADGLSPNPPMPFLPFCVDRLGHLNVYLWFLVSLTAMLLTKHSLNSRGKRLLLEVLVWNGSLLALIGFMQAATDAPGPLWDLTMKRQFGQVSEFFSTFGYPNMAGDYFTTLFGLSIALWRDRVERITQEYKESDRSKLAIKPRQMFWKKHYLLIPAALAFFAALNTLSRAAILLVTASTGIFFVHTFISFLAHKPRVVKFKRGVWWLITFLLVVYAAIIFMPKDFEREVNTLDATTVLDRVSGRGQYHTRVATEIWKDHKLFGCGGWGYVHFCIPKMTEAERKRIQMVGGINVHNDYLQFLAEHGAIGFGALVTIVVLLLWPVIKAWKRLARVVRFVTDHKLRPPRPYQLFVLPAPIFCILVALICTCIHAFGDCPLRSPAVMALFFVSLAAMSGFLSTNGKEHHHASC